MITNRKEKLINKVKKEEERLCFMEAKEKKTEEKKTMKEKLHDYFMEQSKQNKRNPHKLCFTGSRYTSLVS